MLRVIVLVNAVALNLYRADNFARPAAGVACVVVMTGWTAVAIWAYAEPRRRTPGLLLADLAVAEALILVSPMVKGEGMQATVPGFWVMGALFAWAIHWRWLGGLVAGVALALSDLAVRSHVTQANYGNVFLLLIGGPIVGFMCASLAQMADERDRAERAAAAAAERARLARAVHDGVLQVLALVQRRGAELGGDAADLGRLAGEQEVALRTLIRRQDAVEVPAGSGPAPDADLTSALTRLEATRRVTVAAPAQPVLLPAEVVDELVSVVAACLDNVAVHVGRRRRRGCCWRSSRTGCRCRSATRGPASRGPPRPGRPRRDAWASPSPSGAGSPTSAAPPTWSPVRSAPSGSSPCRGRDRRGPRRGGRWGVSRRFRPYARLRDDPRRAPVPRPRPGSRTPPAGPAGRDGDAVDGR